MDYFFLTYESKELAYVETYLFLCLMACVRTHPTPTLSPSILMFSYNDLFYVMFPSFTLLPLLIYVKDASEFKCI